MTHDERKRGFHVGQELWQVMISGVARVTVAEIHADRIVVRHVADAIARSGALIVVRNGHFFVSREDAAADFARVLALRALGAGDVNPAVGQRVWVVGRSHVKYETWRVHVALVRRIVEREGQRYVYVQIGRYLTSFDETFPFLADRIFRSRSAAYAERRRRMVVRALARKPA